MLKLFIPGVELWDDKEQVFVKTVDTTLELEHSLISLSKWEAIWEKPFLGPEEKTTEETLGYIYNMCLTPDVPPEVFQSLTNDHLKQVNNYMNAKMSATWFSDIAERGRGPQRKEIITAEVLYYWMYSAGIDQSWETRHLGRFFTLLKVFNEKNATPKKTNKLDSAAKRRLLNEQRLAQSSGKG